MTVAALAQRFGVAAQTMHNWLVAADIPRRPAAVAARADVDDEEVRQLYVRRRSGS
jgi:transposase-like protein